MNTTSTKLVAILSIVAVGLAASTASAKDKGNNNNNNNNNSNKNKSSFSIGIGIGGSSFGASSINHNKNYHKNTTYVKKIYVPVEPCYYPRHCFAWVLPGDTWATLSLREYGNPNLFPSIASFNRLSLSLPLVVGQQIRLPEIHPHGVLRVSFAPAPAPFVLPMQAVAPIAMPALPINAAQNIVGGPSAIGPQTPIGTQNVTAAPTAGPTLPNFAIGSVIQLDGQLGSDAGTARVKFSGVTLKAEVIEWTAGSVKIRLPEVELAAPLAIELEVLRADGSLAAKSGLQLTPAATKLAQGN